MATSCSIYNFSKSTLNEKNPVQKRIIQCQRLTGLFCAKSRSKENYIVLEINSFVLRKYHLPLKIRTRARRQKGNLKDCILPEILQNDLLLLYLCWITASLSMTFINCHALTRLIYKLSSRMLICFKMRNSFRGGS